MEIRTPSSDGTERDSTDRLSSSAAFAVLADDCRRQTLAELKAATLPLDEQSLAAAVAARTGPDGTGSATDEQSRSVAVQLQHVHLPKLAANGLVERDDGRVEAVSSSVRGDGLVADVLDRADALDADSLDRLCEVLSNARHRQVLATLRDAADPLTLDELVRALAHRDARTVTERDVDRLRTWLHHATLPKLLDAELVEAVSTDDETRYAYRGHPFVRSDWL